MSMPVTRAMKLGSAVLAAAVVAVAVVHTFAAQPVPRLALQLEDYAQLPITGELDGQNTRGQLARVNFMRDEPGGRRFFVNDLNGPLYILDKQTKKFTVYLDFNGLGARPGLFPKFTFERNFATGLTNFLFDPDYARNGVFYTMHMEDPAGPGTPAPKPGVVAGLDLSGYTTTPAIPTPTVDGKIEREVVLIEWKDRNPANATFEGTARELMRLQHPLPQHPLGEMTFNPVARRGDPDWRVMYIGAGDSGSGDQKRQPPHQPAAARHARRQDPAHRARPARAHGDEHGQRERPLPDPQRQSVHDPRGRPQGDLGLRPAQSASADLGRRSGAAEGAAAAGVPHRAGVVGDGRRHPQGRELRLAAARRHAGAVARRHGPDPAGRHDSDPDLGHRHARHGQADLSGAAVPAPARRAATPSPTGSSIAASRSPR